MKQTAPRQLLKTRLPEAEALSPIDKMSLPVPCRNECLESRQVPPVHRRATAEFFRIDLLAMPP